MIALSLGDDALVLSHRLSEWAGRAPVLEEEVALANIALDLLGQARALYALLGDLEGLGDEDALAFRRDERDFRNAQLVEQPNGDFAHTIARQLYYSTWQELVLTELASSASASEIGQVAAKALPEVAYHRDHAVTWTLRLGDGTADSHARMRQATQALWRYTGELFQPGWPQVRSAWDTRVATTLREATLPLPTGPRTAAWSAGAGRQGIHTEPFGHLLAEMQHLHRSHPGATW